MRFKSEKIVRDEDKKYFNSFGLKDILGDLVEPYWWAIDKETGIFLFSRGGGVFEVPESFGLYIDGDLIEIEVLEETEGDRFDNNLKIHWFIRKIYVPRKVIEKGYDENEIRGLVQEAFIGLGTTGIERTKILDVTVKIMAELKIV